MGRLLNRLRGDETVIRLQGEQALLELKKQEADILASSAPTAEKVLELEKLMRFASKFSILLMNLKNLSSNAKKR